MEQIAKAEPERRQGESLEQVAERFRHWRETRIRGNAMPRRPERRRGQTPYSFRASRPSCEDSLQSCGNAMR